MKAKYKLTIEAEKEVITVFENILNELLVGIREIKKIEMLKIEKVK